MSYNTGTAFRIPLEKMHEFEEEVRPKVIDNVTDYIKDLLEAIDPMDLKAWIEDNDRLYPDEDYDENACVRFLSLYGLDYLADKARKDLLHKEFNFEHGWKVYLDECFAYLIPYGFTPSPSSYPNYAEDYKYWNGTDRPEGVSRGEWIERGEKWDSLFHESGYSSAGFKAPFKIVAVSVATKAEKDYSFRKLRESLEGKIDGKKARDIIMKMVELQKDGN